MPKHHCWYVMLLQYKDVGAEEIYNLWQNGEKLSTSIPSEMQHHGYRNQAGWNPSPCLQMDPIKVTCVTERETLTPHDAPAGPAVVEYSDCFSQTS